MKQLMSLVSGLKVLLDIPLFSILFLILVIISNYESFFFIYNPLNYLMRI